MKHFGITTSLLLLALTSNRCNAQFSEQAPASLNISGQQLDADRGQIWDGGLSPSISPEISMDYGKFCYETNTMSEMRRLFHTSPGDDDVVGGLFIRKALLALPVMRRGNASQLFLRPESQMYLALFKKYSMKKFMKSVRIEKPAGTVAIDTHVHTCYSHDSMANPKDMILAAAGRGLSGIAITDHNNMEGSRRAQKIVAELIQEHRLPESFFIIPGEEISSTKGHIIGLFLSKEISSGMSPLETIRAIHEQGGFAVSAHPLLPDCLGDLSTSLPWDAIESMNAVEELHFAYGKNAAQRKRREFYDGISLPKLGSSDAHDSQTIGMCYSVLTCASTPEAVHSALLAGNVRAIAGIPEADLNHLVRHGLPHILSFVESVTVPGQWITKLTHADSVSYSFLPRPSIQLRWSRKF